MQGVLKGMSDTFVQFKLHASKNLREVKQAENEKQTVFIKLILQ